MLTAEEIKVFWRKKNEKKMYYFKIPCVRKCKYFLKQLPVRYDSLNDRRILAH